MNVFGIDLTPFINELLGIIVTGVVAYAGKLIKDHVHIKNKETYANIAVQFTEQIAKDTKLEDKFDHACKWLESQLKKKGIKFDGEEIEGLVESAVLRLKNGLLDSMKK